jgi:hypothetical protein
MLLYGDTRKVCDLLTQSGEAVEKSGFARVRWTYECDCLLGRRLVTLARRVKTGSGGGAMAVAHDGLHLDEKLQGSLAA